MRQVRRRDGDGIAWLADERRLARKDGVGVKSVGRRRGDARLPDCCDPIVSINRNGIGMSQRDGTRVFVGLSVCRDPYRAPTDRQKLTADCPCPPCPCPMAWGRTGPAPGRNELPAPGRMTGRSLGSRSPDGTFWNRPSDSSGTAHRGIGSLEPQGALE
jgi:hypothetical protein